MRKHWIIAPILVAAIVFLQVSDYASYLAASVLIWANAAAGVRFLHFRAGELSFGQGLAFGVAAYTYVVLGGATTLLSASLVMAVAILAASAAAAVVGLIAFRARGVYFTLMSLCAAELVRIIVTRSYDSLGGDNGIQNVAVPPILQSEHQWCMVAVAMFALVNMAFSLLMRTTWGWRVDAQRQAYRRTASLGINPEFVRWQAIVVSALPAGVAGTLVAAHEAAVNPSLLSWVNSGDFIAITLLGGDTWFGALASSTLLVAGRAVLASSTDYWRSGVGLLILIALAVRLYARSFRRWSGIVQADHATSAEPV